MYMFEKNCSFASWAALRRPSDSKIQDASSSGSLNDSRYASAFSSGAMNQVPSVRAQSPRYRDIVRRSRLAEMQKLGWIIGL
jgi:hypothetical protein